MFEFEIGGRQGIANEHPPSAVPQFSLSQQPGSLKHWEIESFLVAECSNTGTEFNLIAVAADPICLTSLRGAHFVPLLFAHYLIGDLQCFCWWKPEHTAAVVAVKPV